MSMAVAEGAEKRLNDLAREQMKARLLADLAIDAQVCELEGWDFAGYVAELLGEVERIAVGMRRGSEVPAWRHVCGRCGERISVFDASCKACGAVFDMARPMERHLLERGA